MKARVGLVLVLVVVGLGLGPMVGSGQADVTLTVTVETAAGQPVADARLIANWSGGTSEATTAANGKAFIDVERGADVTIEVEHPEYIRNHPVTVEDAAERSVDVVVHPKASARVTVSDSDGPVAGVLVSFRKGDRIAVRATTDGNGVVSVGPIEAGQYTVSLRKSRYLTKIVTMDLSGQTSAQLSIQRGSLTLTFNVTDEYFSPPRPLEDVTIRIADVGSIQTQANGIQQISVPVNMRLTVRVSKSGYQTVEQTITVGEADRRIHVTLRRVPALSVEPFNDRVVVGEEVQVEVTNEYGEPVADAEVRLDGTRVATTDDEGRVRVPIDSAGSHEVVAAVGDLSSEPVTVTGVREGGTDTATTTRRTEGPGLDGFGWGVGAVGFVLAVLVGRYRLV